MLDIERETFKIDVPDEIAEYSAVLYKELVDLIEKREGKLVKFASLAQRRRVVNDLAILAAADKNDVFSDKVKKTQHQKIYLRPTAEREEA